MSNPVNLHVYMRSGVGTTLLWRTDVLTPEQKSEYKLEARLSPGEPWFLPKICEPMMRERLQELMDKDTDGIMIPHQVTGRINENVGFELRMTFGRGAETLEAFLKVESKNSYMPYVKPQRIEDGQRIVYAQPVYVAGVSPNVIDQIAEAVSNKVGRPKT